MSASYRFHGHAIVSADDHIADASGTMPKALRHPADWRRFQHALDEATLVVLGRRSHEASPNLRHRRRLIVSSTVAGLELRTDGWWWNPAGAALALALRSAAPEGGVVAIPGGRRVFDFFLAIGFDAFDLARAGGLRLPSGIPIFSACAQGRSAEELLFGGGLQRQSTEVLDEKEDVSVALWRRPE